MYNAVSFTRMKLVTLYTPKISFTQFSTKHHLLVIDFYSVYSPAECLGRYQCENFIEKMFKYDAKKIIW